MKQNVFGYQCHLKNVSLQSATIYLSHELCILVRQMRNEDKKSVYILRFLLALLYDDTDRFG